MSKSVKKFVLPGLVIMLALVTSCDQFVGPAGLQGEPGPAVYLEDAQGTRYYSGSSIDLGFVEYGGSAVNTGFTLVNATTEGLSFSGETVFFVDSELHQYNPSSLGSLDHFPGDGNHTPISELSLSPGGIVTGTVVPAGGESEAFSLTLSPTASSYGFLVRRRYRIELAAASGNFDFVFEIVGAASGGSGW